MFEINNKIIEYGGDTLISEPQLIFHPNDSTIIAFVNGSTYTGYGYSGFVVDSSRIYVYNFKSYKQDTIIKVGIYGKMINIVNSNYIYFYDINNQLCIYDYIEKKIIYQYKIPITDIDDNSLIITEDGRFLIFLSDNQKCSFFYNIETNSIDKMLWDNEAKFIAHSYKSNLYVCQFSNGKMRIISLPGFIRDKKQLKSNTYSIDYEIKEKYENLNKEPDPEIRTYKKLLLELSPFLKNIIIISPKLTHYVVFDSTLNHFDVYRIFKKKNIENDNKDIIAVDDLSLIIMKNNDFVGLIGNLYNLSNFRIRNPEIQYDCDYYFSRKDNQPIKYSYEHALIDFFKDSNNCSIFDYYEYSNKYDDLKNKEDSEYWNFIKHNVLMHPIVLIFIIFILSLIVVYFIKN